MNRVRSLLLLACALALALLVAAPLAADEKKADKTHDGLFVSAAKDGKSFTMTNKEGKSEHSHTLSADFKCMDGDGKECKLSDLAKGQMIRVTTKPDDAKVATKVEVMKKK
jgi:hypothetical protein